jgi:hypothetical protein
MICSYRWHRLIVVKHRFAFVAEVVFVHRCPRQVADIVLVVRLDRVVETGGENLEVERFPISIMKPRVYFKTLIFNCIGRMADHTAQKYCLSRQKRTRFKHLINWPVNMTFKFILSAKHFASLQSKIGSYCFRGIKIYYHFIQQKLV